MLCSGCGATVENGTVFCPRCGQNLNLVSDNDKEKQALVNNLKIADATALRLRNSNNKLKVAVILMGILLALAAFVTLCVGAYGFELQSKTDNLESKVFSYEQKVKDLDKSNKELQNKADFFDSYAGICTDDGTGLYHKYGCPDLDDSSFWIYNTGALESNGFAPCPVCCD